MHRRRPRWFDDAQRGEQALQHVDDDATLARVLRSDDAGAVEQALYAVSRQGRAALRPEVAALIGAPGPVGWGARRVHRCMGWTCRHGHPA